MLHLNSEAGVRAGHEGEVLAPRFGSLEAKGAGSSTHEGSAAYQQSSAHNHESKTVRRPLPASSTPAHATPCWPSIPQAHFLAPPPHHPLLRARAITLGFCLRTIP